ncbi:tRNA N6-adenosine threonylcarbamoyltransferase [Leucoagaricus sp. SymC.cos]|nr:tRNA N6-adenosine threonylcarbamoyltransferase [Leucoagaricus sp. SymC.cos]
MQGHALTPLLTSQEPPKFPFLTLLTSGGHTLLLLARSKTEFQILATTADEAIGRCIDRVARLLQIKWGTLGFGAALEQFVNEDPDPDITGAPPFPKPMQKQLAFSFAGFHSYMDIYLRDNGGIKTFDIPQKRRLARAFQASVFAHVEEKVLLALDWCTQQNIHIQDLVVSGGVASNQYFRERLRQCLDSPPLYQPIRLVFPPAHLCTGIFVCPFHSRQGSNGFQIDNAVMIAWASMHRFLAGDHDSYDITTRTKWSIEELSER